MPNVGDDTPVRVLHLSDFHFRHTKRWDADPVLRSLAEFVGNEIQNGLKPDLVAITGDIAFGGAPQEYKLAKTWLVEKLWPLLGDLSPERFLIIPGNHDVDRARIGRLARLSQAHLLDARSQDEIAKVFLDKQERAVLLDRHRAYLAFIADCFGDQRDTPWWERTLEIHGVTLHIAGLNSAWLSSGDDDRGRLLLSRYQVNQTIVTEKGDTAHWRLALVHHPWDYLAEFDTYESRNSVHQHCDVLMRGHLHFPASERTVRPDPGRSCLELAAGCIYENSQYPNAFQWVELHPNKKRVRVMFRTWQHGSWGIDRNQPNCPDGHHEFDLLASPTAAPTAPTTPVKVFLSYSKDSNTRTRKVTELATRLRHDGVDAIVDTYFQAPPQGWPLWYEAQIESADFVIVICSKRYHSRLVGEELKPAEQPFWEGRIIRQLLYDAGSVRQKFIPVLLSNDSPDYIPTPLRSFTRFTLSTNQGYKSLLRLLTGVPAATLPPLGPLVELVPPRATSPGRATQLSEAKMILVGSGRVGKTSLVRCLTGKSFDPYQCDD